MTASLQWDAIPPTRPCAHPDGHIRSEIVNHLVTIPIRVVCPRCGDDWTVITWPRDASS